VDHEGGLRKQLGEHAETGEDLRKWRRAFFLDPSLRPTRHQVIDLQPVRGAFSDQWFASTVPHAPDEAVEVNRRAVGVFLEALEGTFQRDAGDSRRTDPQIHLTAAVPLQSTYEELLTQVRLADPRDSAQWAGLLLQVGRYLEQHPDAVCTVYRMSQGQPRERSIDGAGEIPNLFQGANYDESVTPRQMVYPGDREIHSNGQLTVQIHTLDVKDGATTVARDVPAITVWVPRAMAAAWLSQVQR
jgi:hypothetical protein